MVNINRNIISNNIKKKKKNMKKRKIYYKNDTNEYKYCNIYIYIGYYYVYK